MLSKVKDKVIDIIATIAMALIIYLDDIIETIITMVVAVVCCLVLVNYVFMPVIVDGTSMYPTLKDSQIGFSNILSKNMNGVDRFDIVVIYLEAKDENLVKRVIGLPGETVSFVNDTLYIDGKPIEQYFLDTDYVNGQIETSYTGYFTNDFTVTLGDDEYFCLGDNRLVSQDSRYYGAFSLEQIVAKDVFVIYPFDCFGKAE